MNEEEREGGTLEHVFHKMEDAVGGLAGRAGAAMTEHAEDFVRAAAVSDMYEIEASELALRRTRSPEIREAAEKMIADHTDSIGKLQDAMPPELAESVPRALDQRRKTMLLHLLEAEDADFENMYLDHQVAAHKEAVTLMRHFSDHGDDAGLRSFAREVAPIIERHLKKMQALAG